MPSRNKLLVLFLLSSFELVAQSFQGAITFQIQSNQQKGELELWLSPKGIRAEFKGESPLALLMPRDSVEAYRLNAKTKTYIELDLKEQRRLSMSLGKLEKFEVEKFGKEKFLNEMCHHFKLKSPKREIEIWMAESLADSITLSRIIDAGALIGLSPNAVEAMQKENLNGLPLKVIATEPSGIARVEAKRIQRKSFKSSLFELPKSYRKEETDGN